MDYETIVTLIITGTVFFFLFGIYRTTIGKQEQAKDNIKTLMGTKKATAVDVRQHQDNVLKKRKKGDANLSARIEIKLERANMMITFSEFLMICIVSGVLCFLIALLALGLGPFFGLIIGLGGGFFPYLFLNIKIWLRMSKADAEFANVLDALVNCFKTGYGFSRAVQVIAENYDDPWGTEFGKMAMEMNLGSTQEDVLNSLSERIPSADVDLFVTALIIQKETGGNMAELLMTLSGTCRERYKLYRKVGAISAQGKLSATIICLVPPGLMGLMSIFIHDPVVEFVTNPIGQVILVVVGIWMCIGIGVLFKIVQVEV